MTRCSRSAWPSSRCSWSGIAHGRARSSTFHDGQRYRLDEVRTTELGTRFGKVLFARRVGRRLGTAGRPRIFERPVSPTLGAQATLSLRLPSHAAMTNRRVCSLALAALLCPVGLTACEHDDAEIGVSWKLMRAGKEVSCADAGAHTVLVEFTPVTSGNGQFTLECGRTSATLLLPAGTYAIRATLLNVTNDVVAGPSESSSVLADAGKVISVEPFVLVVE
jgi:hypothetical protein